MKTILSAFLLICCSLISQAQVYPVNANLEDEKSFLLICCSLISQAQVYPVNANLEDEKSYYAWLH